MNVLVDRLNKINLLYPQIPIKLRTGFDRYGFSYIMADRLGKPCLRSFGNWLHGWIWWDAECPEDLMFDRNLRNKPHIVSDIKQKVMLDSFGFSKVAVAGLPFSYFTNSGCERVPGSLLAMPPHSSERDKIKGSVAEFYDYVYSIKKDFSCVCVSLHSCDATIDNIRLIESMGLSYIVGARPDDKNGLARMRGIFDIFDYVTTGTFGSHIAYAAFSGCKVSISGPLYKWSESDFSGGGDLGLKYLDRILVFYSKEYTEGRYPQLYLNDPKCAVSQIEFGKSALGFSNVADDISLEKLFSWDFKGQLIGYINAIRFSLFGH